MPRVNIGFLQDLLGSVAAAPRLGFRRSPRPAAERLAEAIGRLTAPAGEATRIAAAAQALDAFAELAEPDKAAVFRRLLTEFGVDAAPIRAAFAAWDATESPADLARLFRVAEPRRQALLRALNQCPGGTIQLVRMREDLLRAMKADPELAPVDADFLHLFRSWFNRGFLVLREIDWNSPAAVLEKIVAYEAVHEINGWDDLRRRLDPPDRRCFAFFHPAAGDEPLVFVEVALTRGVPDAIAPILEGGGEIEPEEADTAVFYSISNCQRGLAGVSFGSFLIKQVVQELASELPNLDAFVTLSPVPGFAAWLAAQGDEAELAEALSADWTGSEDALAPRVRAAAARYLTAAKDAEGRPADPVARFHLGNGAELHAVHWPADLGPRGRRDGCGVMVNYLYDLGRIDARHEAYATERAVAAGPAVQRLLKARAPARAGR